MGVAITLSHYVIANNRALHPPFWTAKKAYRSKGALQQPHKQAYGKNITHKVPKIPRSRGVHGKMALGEGLAEMVGKGSAKGWQRVGERLAKGWRRVGTRLAKGWRVSLHPPILPFPKRPFRRAGHGNPIFLSMLDVFVVHNPAPHTKQLSQGDSQLQPLSRLRATDVVDNSSNNAVSCGGLAS